MTVNQSNSRRVPKRRSVPRNPGPSLDCPWLSENLTQKKSGLTRPNLCFAGLLLSLAPSTLSISPPNREPSYSNIYLMSHATSCRIATNFVSEVMQRDNLVELKDNNSTQTQRLTPKKESTKKPADVWQKKQSTKKSQSKRELSTRDPGDLYEGFFDELIERELDELDM
jgi:hypothetical protein